MKNVIKMGLFFIMTFIIVGCGISGNQQSEKDDDSVNGSNGVGNSDRNTISEVREGDIIYRLVVEKDSYQTGEEVKIYAELEYIGEEDSITIGHAMSPFYFPIYEKTREYTIDYAMEEPLIMTEIKKGTPHREYYKKSYGYSGEEDNDYIKFVKKFYDEDGFPTGDYELNGRADFFVENSDGEPKMYKMEGKVEFSVK